VVCAKTSPMALVHTVEGEGGLGLVWPCWLFDTISGV